MDDRLQHMEEVVGERLSFLEGPDKAYDLMELLHQLNTSNLDVYNQQWVDIAFKGMEDVDSVVKKHMLKLVCLKQLKLNLSEAESYSESFYVGSGYFGLKELAARIKSPVLRATNKAVAKSIELKGKGIEIPHLENVYYLVEDGVAFVTYGDSVTMIKINLFDALLEAPLFEEISGISQNSIMSSARKGKWVEIDNALVARGKSIIHCLSGDQQLQLDYVITDIVRKLKEELGGETWTKEQVQMYCDHVGIGFMNEEFKDTFRENDIVSSKLPDDTIVRRTVREVVNLSAEKAAKPYGG